MRKQKASSSSNVIDLFGHETKEEEKERKSRVERKFVIGPKLCLKCFSAVDVKDVDILEQGSEIPNRTRLCRDCRLKTTVVFERD